MTSEPRIDLFKQIKAFDYMCVTGELPGITGNQRSVYFALLSINNSTYWSETFDVDFKYVLDLAKVDKDTYRRAMDYFNEKNLFKGYIKGVNHYVRAKVSLKLLYEIPTGNATGNAVGNAVSDATGNAVSDAHSSKTIHSKNKTLKNFKTREGAFAPPSLVDCENFFVDILSLDREEGGKFFNHYKSNGWKIGGSKMDDWHASAKRWKDKIPDFKKEKGSAQKEKSTYPNYWSQKFADTLHGTLLSNYYKHLYSLGLKVVKDSLGNITDFQPPQPESKVDEAQRRHDASLKKFRGTENT